jgi:hypothetical protein
VPQGGPTVSYTARAETLLSFLRTMATATGWEWALVPAAVDARGASVKLVWAERIGEDVRGLGFEQGASITEASLEQDAEGFLASAVLVGGTGTFADRPAAAVTISGQSAGGIDANPLEQPQRPSSPALAGTRVIVEQQVTNRDVLMQGAAKQHVAPRWVRERLSLTVAEAELDLTKLGLGNYYRFRTGDLALGLGVERIVRVIAFDLGDNGLISIEAQVLKEQEVRRYVGAV